MVEGIISVHRATARPYLMHCGFAWARRWEENFGLKDTKFKGLSLKVDKIHDKYSKFCIIAKLPTQSDQCLPILEIKFL